MPISERLFRNVVSVNGPTHSTLPVGFTVGAERGAYSAPTRTRGTAGLVHSVYLVDLLWTVGENGGQDVCLCEAVWRIDA